MAGAGAAVASAARAAVKAAQVARSRELRWLGGNEINLKSPPTPPPPPPLFLFIKPQAAEQPLDRFATVAKSELSLQIEF